MLRKTENKQHRKSKNINVGNGLSNFNEKPSIYGITVLPTQFENFSDHLGVAMDAMSVATNVATNAGTNAATNAATIGATNAT